MQIIYFILFIIMSKFWKTDIDMLEWVSINWYDCFISYDCLYNNWKVIEFYIKDFNVMYWYWYEKYPTQKQLLNMEKKALSYLKKNYK